ncbi:MAG: NAD(P)-dependent oxidoreductase [Gammaproteobacteria bacterium]|nr:NAD(P)-dependent oxidoreductase [Gammaproteobacteria bacterium]
MKYLILGSAGQIGLSLTKYIRQLGHEAIEFDVINDAQDDLRLPNNPRLLEKMQAADFVFFLAFDVGGSRYLKIYQNTFEFISNNAKLMQNTFEMLKKTNKPFIFASSQMSNMGYSPYGQLKALGETYTKILNGLVVKFWNVYGVEHDLDKSHVITDFILKAEKNKIIDMMTDGTEQRQFLYADDCSECLLKLASEYQTVPRGQELHITNFKWDSILYIANIIADLYPGTQIKPGKSNDTVQLDKRNEPDPFILKYWQPKTDLAEGIRLVNTQMMPHSIKERV